MSAAALLVAAALASPAQVQTSIEPQSAFLGDPLELDVLVLTREPVRVDARLGPLRELEPRRIERDGDLVRVRIRASCTAAACLARTVALPKVRVHAGGTTFTRAWPAVRFGTRTPADVSAETPWRLDDLVPPAVSFRVRPSVLEGMLIAFAVLLAALAVVLVALELLRSGAARSRRTLTPLERALRAARAAVRGDEAARRRALGALARVVGADGFARRAQAAAWADEPPSSAQVEELARAAEQEARR
jgi:hypothetical protein